MKKNHIYLLALVCAGGVSTHIHTSTTDPKETHGKCPQAFLVCTNEDTSKFPYNNYSQWFGIDHKNEYGIYENLATAVETGKLYTHTIEIPQEYGPELSKKYEIEYVKAPVTFNCWWHYTQGGGACKFVNSKKRDVSKATIKKAKQYCRIHYGMKHGALIGVGDCKASW